MLLHRGRIIFSGSPQKVAPFLKGFGYCLPERSNLSDYCMEILSAEENRQKLDRMASEYSLQQLSADIGMEAPNANPPLDLGPKFAVPFHSQLYYLTRRSCRQSYRHPINITARLVQNVILALFVGVLFGSDASTAKTQRDLVAKVGFVFFMICVNSLLGTVSSVVLFHEERTLYFREKANKVYKTSAYFLGKTLIELPLQILTPIVFGSIPYYMIGLKPDWTYFFRFCLGLVVLGQASESLGLILGALVKAPTTAVMMSPLLLIPFLLVTGFFLNLNSIPLYLVWIKVLSPQKYIFAALLQTEFTNQHFYCGEDELVATPAGDLCPFTSGEQVLGFFSIPPSTMMTSTMTSALEKGLDQTPMYPSTNITTPFVDQFDYMGNILMCLLVALVYRVVAYLCLRCFSPRTLGN